MCRLSVGLHWVYSSISYDPNDRSKVSVLRLESDLHNAANSAGYSRVCGQLLGPIQPELIAPGSPSEHTCLPQK